MCQRLGRGAVQGVVMHGYCFLDDFQQDCKYRGVIEVGTIGNLHYKWVGVLFRSISTISFNIFSITAASIAF